MVAELLRLKFVVLFGPMRWSSAARREAALTVFGLLLLGAGVAAASFVILEWDAAFARRIVPVLGSAAAVLVLSLPILGQPRDVLPLEALRSGRHSTVLVAVTLAAATLIGPTALFLFATVGPAVLWGDPRVANVTLLCAGILVVQTVLLVRVGVAAGSGLRRHPRVRAIARLVFAALAVIAVVVTTLTVLPRAVAVLTSALLPTVWAALAWAGDSGLESFVDVVARSPLGAAWAAPSVAANGGDPNPYLASAVIGAVVLGAAWWYLVWRAMRPVRPARNARTHSRPGWFRLAPTTSLGAVIARSASYWSRDPRYSTTIPLVVAVPAVLAAAFSISGVPADVAALVVLPVTVILVTWATSHNDVALDSTAIWMHVAGAVRGVDDRVGRAIPVVAIGGLVLLVGVPLSVAVIGDLAAAPAVIGLGVAAVLGTLGVSSVANVSHPYPTARPGSNGFEHPETTERGVVSAQARSLGASALAVAPAWLAAALWLVEPSSAWNVAAFVAGVCGGAIALGVGLARGIRLFDERASDVLSIAARH